MHRLTTRVLPIFFCTVCPRVTPGALGDCPSLTNNCKGMGLIFWFHIFSRKSPNPIFSVLRHAAACFKTPTNSPQKQVLRHAAACFNRWCLVPGSLPHGISLGQEKERIAPHALFPLWG